MNLSSRIFLGFSIIIALSLVNSYVNYILSQEVNRNTDFLVRSESVIRNSSKIHKGMIDMQSAFRGYLLTDDNNFLAPYYQGLKSTPLLIAEEMQLIKESSHQRLKLDSISMLHKQWTEYSNSLIEARQKKNIQPDDEYQKLFETRFKAQVGKKINDAISHKFQEFDRYEYAIREQRRAQLHGSIRLTQIGSIIFILLTILIGIISTLVILNIIRKRIAFMVNVAQNIARGDFKHFEDNKKDELSSLSSSLNVMSDTLDQNINELQKRNRELDQFAYVVSHDLKAPLRGIYHAVQWIEEDLSSELSGQMKKYLSIIPERIRRMDDLIDGLLDYARVSRKSAEKEYVDINILLTELTELIVPENFSVEIGLMPSLYTEKVRLGQVFSNLISNAVKYIDHNEPSIHITCQELEKFYEFTVTDNGPGIDPRYHEKIFVIFQTLREKNAKESTGIGLAIVHKIISDQNCSIKLVSEVGKGASFIFTWPKK